MSSRSRVIKNFDHWTENGSVWFDTWVVISENMTEEHDMVFAPQRKGVVVFGAALSAWILLITGLLTVLILRRRDSQASRSLNILTLNFVTPELLTGAIIVPMTVHTERVGQWQLGPYACRGWLVLQILLTAWSIWAAMMVTFDRLVYVIQPTTYARRLRQSRLVCMVLGSWIAAVLTVIPPAAAIVRDPSLVLDELCAVNMSRNYAIGVSFTAFFVPALLVLIATITVLFAVCKARNRQKGYSPDTGSDDGASAVGLIDVPTLSNVAGCLLAVNSTIITFWAPFYVLNMMIPSCDGLCVSPSLWSACVWLGYTSAGLAPAFWFLDHHLRQQLKKMFGYRKGITYPGNYIPPTKAAYEKKVNISY